MSLADVFDVLCYGSDDDDLLVSVPDPLELEEDELLMRAHIDPVSSPFFFRI